MTMMLARDAISSDSTEDVVAVEAICDPILVLPGRGDTQMEGTHVRSVRCIAHATINRTLSIVDRDATPIERRVLFHVVQQSTRVVGVEDIHVVTSLRVCRHESPSMSPGLTVVT